MPGDKKFKTKELSSQINSARLLFADAEDMIILRFILRVKINISEEIAKDLKDNKNYCWQSQEKNLTSPNGAIYNMEVDNKAERLSLNGESV